METDILIVGSGVAGLFCALHLPRQYRVLLLSKDALDRSDSYLAQGGICVLPEAADEDAFFEDTMRAGHYENNPDAVRTMIRSSRGVIDELIAAGVSFARRGEELLFTREGGHSRPRILFHEDITGREITSKLLARVRALPNVTLLPHTTMLDLIEEGGRCRGAVLRVRRASHRLGAVHGARLRRDRRPLPALDQLPALNRRRARRLSAPRCPARAS